jgi:ribosome biogenesis protein UTP30
MTTVESAPVTPVINEDTPKVMEAPKNLNKNLSKALCALIDFEQKKSNKSKTENKDGNKKNLLDVDEDEGSTSSADKKSFYVMFGLKKIPAEVSVKPQLISIPNSWKSASSADSVRVCIFTKDPHEEYKKRIKALGVASIVKVMPVSKLRKNFKPFEAKRQLCASYDIFLTDCRIVSLLPKLIGKKFFESKKIPVVVDLTKEDLKSELETAINSTYLHMTSGPCFSVKIGLGSQEVSALTENGAQIIKQVIEKIPGGWDNIKVIHVKTPDSLALPVYTCNSTVE